MKKEERLIPIGKKMFWGTTFVGIMWIGTGLAGMFDNLICNILAILFHIGAIVALLKVYRIIRIGDDSDEYNLIKAQAKAGGALIMVLCIASIVFLLVGGLVQNMDIDWMRIVPQIFFIIMAIYILFVGLFFRKLEAE